MVAADGVHKLRVDTHSIFGPASTPLQNEADTQFSGDVTDVRGRTLVGKTGIACNHE